MKSPGIALIGCGAVAEMLHVPALRKRPELLKSLILVDADLARARALRERLGALDAAADYRDVMSRVKGAFVLTPHRLHVPITLDLVRHGVAVLCEKPLAEKASEVDAIVEASRAHGVPVAVNQTRRLFSSFREVRRLIREGALGELREVHYELGEPFQWPAASPAYFGVRGGGRGVLFDTGAHIVDLVCWWLGAQPEVVEYEDDSHGGTEAVARMTLRAGSVAAHVHLSWLTKLKNEYRVVGSRASAHGGIYEWSSYTLADNARERKVRTDKPWRTIHDFTALLLDNFVEVIAGRAQPLVRAADVRPSIATIEECYRRRASLREPWHDACDKLVSHA